MKCILCPKENKKPAEFVFTGNSYCWDCYYIRREEVNKLNLEYESRKKELEDKLK